MNGREQGPQEPSRSGAPNFKRNRVGSLAADISQLISETSSG